MSFRRVPVPVGDHAAPVRGGAEVLPPDPAVRAAQRHGARLLPAAAAQAARAAPRAPPPHGAARARRHAGTGRRRADSVYVQARPAQ